MAGKKLSYPAHTPNSVQDITKDFINEYMSYNVENGKISIEDLNAWISIVEKAEADNPGNPVKAFAEYRRKFVEKYYSHLLAKKSSVKASDYFKALRDKMENTQKN